MSHTTILQRQNKRKSRFRVAGTQATGSSSVLCPGTSAGIFDVSRYAVQPSRLRRVQDKGLEQNGRIQYQRDTLLPSHQYGFTGRASQPLSIRFSVHAASPGNHLGACDPHNGLSNQFCTALESKALTSPGQCGDKIVTYGPLFSSHPWSDLDPSSDRSGIAPRKSYSDVISTAPPGWLGYKEPGSAMYIKAYSPDLGINHLVMR
ncbi:hypothetical protein F9C07_2110553 [Aspergillus flavus]|uniref:Uncharacterized protein n=1 Tax=Aspergillus flavus (strain ATCC 200026 / FGSC A1120 / IAM 13836 / NRRL 3357 / JCM 12722 / SRRC 167) TaxID=332952 RepID=A0A7U2MZ55_ASPFN|nr:hypothetical protein F9C07_2110553 [Aspergillus flavus]